MRQRAREQPCLDLGRWGTTPPLPESIAEVVRAHQVSFELAARAVANRDRNLLVQAIRTCPFGNYLQSAEAIVKEAWDPFGLGKPF